MSLYSKRGVSAQKEEVHKATQKLDQGLYAHAFCRIYPDRLGGDPDWINLMHADGAGTKSVLAYLYWKETGDVSVWKGIAQDAVAMNLDDLLCVGIYTNIQFSSTIDRNKRLIPGEVLENIIGGTQEFFDDLKKWGVDISYLGGETADLGDLVRTIAVNGTMTARWKKSGIISNERILPGDLIVGLASDGMATYEKVYNSGIGSNGLTSARHDLLDKSYAARFQESFDGGLDAGVLYIGPYRLGDAVPRKQGKQGMKVPAHLSIGKLLLSPTRTYAPLMKVLLEEYPEKIHGLIHCSGGGQTKCMKYLPGNFRVVKDNLFDPPSVFELIQQASGSNNREMYQVFNMGHRLEIFTDASSSELFMQIAETFGIEAKIVGRVELAQEKELILQTRAEKIIY